MRSPVTSKGSRRLRWSAALALAAVGCRSNDSANTPSSVASSTTGVVTDAAGAAAPAATSIAAAPADAAVRLTTASTGNEARYRVRERLVDHDLPNDAVGRTGAVTGGLALDSAGQVIPSASRFIVRVGGLTSDRDRRDGYVRRRLLESEQYPEVVLAPTSVRGFTLPLLTAGQATFELLGDLTVKGVTRPTVWKVSARFGPDGASGTSAAAFTFADLGLSQPRVPVLLSVADTIRLEYDFRLTAPRS